MKRILLLAFTLALCACSKKDDVPIPVKMSGKWALVNEKSMTSGYIEFQRDRMTEYISSEDLVAMDNAIWHSNESDFSIKDKWDYVIRNGFLFLEERNIGKIYERGDSLFIDDKVYISFESFEDDYYSSISIDLPENRLVLPYDATNQRFSIVINRPLPLSSPVLLCEAEWIKSLTSTDGTVSFYTEAPDTDREGNIIIRYPGAADLEISVSQKCERFIMPASEEVVLDFTSQEATLLYTIKNPVDGEILSATTQASWITNIKVDENQILLQVSQNDEGSTREASIMLSYKEAIPVTVRVIQRFPSMTLEQPSQDTDYRAKEMSFAYLIENKGEGAILKATSKNPWIHNIVVTDSKVNYQVDENNTGGTRQGEINLKYGAIDVVFTVTQTYSAASISLTPASGKHDYTGGAFDFEYSITNERESEAVSASSTCSWLSDIKVNSSKVSYNVAPNDTGKDRLAEIAVKYGNATAIYTITQSVAEFSIAKLSASHGYAATTGSIGYSINNRHSSQQLKMVTTDAWITRLTDTGSAISYAVAENNSGATRSGTITLTYAGVTKTFTVTQTYSAADIVLLHESQTTDYSSKNLKFTVGIFNPKENMSISVQTSVDWIKNLSASRSSVSYTIDKNFSANSREGKITINYENDSKAFTLIQTGHPITELSFNKESITLLTGESESLSVSVFPLDTKLQWSSSDPSIAAIDQNGNVRGLSTGTTVISVASHDGSKSANCVVTIMKEVGPGGMEGTEDEDWGI